MDVHASPGRDRENRGGKDLAIGDDYDKIRKKRPQDFKRGWIAELFRLKDRNILLSRKKFNGGWSQPLTPAFGPVGLGDDSGEFMAGGQEGFERKTGKFSGSQKENFQSFSPSLNSFCIFRLTRLLFNRLRRSMKRIP
jgi:hypothetical protein